MPRTRNALAREHELAEHHKDRRLYSDQGATETGLVAVKSAILINGTGAIALLAFVSQLIGRDTDSAAAMTTLLAPLYYLVGGVLAGAIGTGLGYFRFYFESLYYTTEIQYEGHGAKHITIAKFFERSRFWPPLVVSPFSRLRLWIRRTYWSRC